MTGEVSAARAGTVQLGDRAVYRLGLGTNRLTDTEPARALLRRALELGVNFIDTADVYQSNASEITIGKALGDNARGAVVATKGGMVRTPDGRGADGHPEYLRQAVEGSLQRLGVDCIELYQLHRVDPQVPIETSVGALKEMQQAGQIRRIGLSNVTVAELERARRVATIVSVQNRYNILEREQEPVLEYLRRALDRVHPVDPPAPREPRASEDALGDGGPARGDPAPAGVALAPQTIPSRAANSRHVVAGSPGTESGRGRHRA